jgi:hypothetical protein
MELALGGLTGAGLRVQRPQNHALAHPGTVTPSAFASVLEHLGLNCYTFCTNISTRGYVLLMEVAGVVLNAVPLILYALDNYEKAWDPAKDFWKWGETIGTIRNQIFLQKQQLDTTLKILGLQDPTIDEVEAALQISHPDRSEHFMQIIRHMNNLMDEIARDLYPDAQGPVRCRWFLFLRCCSSH